MMFFSDLWAKLLGFNFFPPGMTTEKLPSEAGKMFLFDPVFSERQGKLQDVFRQDNAMRILI